MWLFLPAVFNERHTKKQQRLHKWNQDFMENVLNCFGAIISLTLKIQNEKTNPIFRVAKLLFKLAVVSV
jgi:hypothetical protein